MNIETIVEEIVSNLRTKSNLNDNTVHHYEKHSLRHLVNYVNSNNITELNDETLNMYLNDAIEKEKNGLIKPRRLREVKRIVFIVKNHLNGIEYYKRRNRETKLYIVDPVYDDFIDTFNGVLPYKGVTNTKMNYFLRIFLDKLKGCEIRNLSNENYHNIYMDMCSRHIADLDNVKLFFKHLHLVLVKYYSIELIDPRCISIRKKYNSLINPYSLDEIKKMVDVSCNVLSKRDLAIFYLALTTGLRACDIRYLKFSDINWTNNTLRFIQRKTGKLLILPLDQSVKIMIQDFIMNDRSLPTNAEDKEIIFLTSICDKKYLSNTASLDGIVNKLEKAANITHINKRSFHSLRRFFATNLIDNDIELLTVSQLLGHSDFSSDKHYISFNKDKVKKCAKGFERIPIRGGVYYVG